MIDLTSPQWEILENAYSSNSAPITQALQELREKEINSDEVKRSWDNIWSSLCHQGTIYPATYAAIPHLVNLIEQKMKKEDIGAQYFIFLTAVHISHQMQDDSIAEKELLMNYNKAIQYAMVLQSQIVTQHISAPTFYSLLSFQAAFKGELALADWLMDVEENK